MRSRVLILVAAIGLGLVAAFAAGRYLDNARSQVEAGTQPVQILVAEKTVEPGVTGEQAMKDGAIVKKMVARRYVAQEAVSSFSAIDGRVCAIDLSPGEQVTTGDFRYSSDAGAAFSVPEGLLAVSIKDDPVRGVSRMVKPGDTVAVLATFELKPGDPKTAITKIFTRSAKVLAVDKNLTAVDSTTEDQDQSSGSLMGASNSSQSGVQMATVTLAVTPREVQQIAFAEDEGKIRLALIGAGAAKPEEVNAVTLKDMLK
jgi:Flp pilus assembly protein CpaB